MKQTNNPSPIAIALVYDGDAAPRVAATGAGVSAQQILEFAYAHNIPIKKDEELAGLLSHLELGEEIPSDLYLVIATVLAFAYLVSGKTSVHGVQTI